MCAYIGIEDLAANALIEILDSINGRFVSYKELEDYGMEVVRLLSTKGEKAVLILSREDTRKMLRNYSDLFEEASQDGVSGIRLKENVNSDQLIEKFRGYLALDVLLAFMNKESIKKLGIN